MGFSILRAYCNQMHILYSPCNMRTHVHIHTHLSLTDMWGVVYPSPQSDFGTVSITTQRHVGEILELTCCLHGFVSLGCSTQRESHHTCHDLGVWILSTLQYRSILWCFLLHSLTPLPGPVHIPFIQKCQLHQGSH